MIISLENNCKSPGSHLWLARILEEELGEKLLRPDEMRRGWRNPATGEYDPSLPPSPEQLKYRVLLKAKFKPPQPTAQSTAPTALDYLAAEDASFAADATSEAGTVESAASPSDYLTPPEEDFEEEEEEADEETESQSARTSQSGRASTRRSSADTVGSLSGDGLTSRSVTAGRSEDSRPSPFTPAVESTGSLQRVVQAASSDDAGRPAAARAGRSRSFASAMVRSPVAAGRRVLSRLLSRSKDPVPPAGAPAAAAGEGAAHGAAAAKLQAAARGRRARAAVPRSPRNWRRRRSARL